MYDGGAVEAGAVSSHHGVHSHCQSWIALILDRFVLVLSCTLFVGGAIVASRPITLLSAPEKQHPLQVVRDFLLHGPITIEGKKFPSLVMYYFGFFKKIQEGHHCNVNPKNVSQASMSPRLQLNCSLLNQHSACVCDVVHWGLSDYLKKRLAHENNMQAAVTFSSVCAGHLNV